MVRVVLVNHVARPEEVNEPLGIQCLSAALRDRFGSAVHVHLELVGSEAEQAAFEEALRRDPPEVLGVSSKIGKVKPLRALYELSQALPRPPVFIVGDQLSTLANAILLPLIPRSICVVGEGEEALCGIVEVLLEGPPEATELRRALLARDVPNCTFLLGGEQRWTQRRTLDLDRAVVPDRPFIERAVREGWIVHAEASRGCPHSRCSFCYINQKYHEVAAWRPLPTATVIADLEQLSAAGARTVFFTDEDFVGPDPDRIWGLAQAILDARAAGRMHPSMAFFISSAARTLLRHDRGGAGRAAELLAHLRAAGVGEIFLGIESGCEAQLRRFVKGATVDENLKAIEWVRASGIDLDLGFLPFDPWTTVDELAENLAFLERAELVHQPVRLLKTLLLTPGTPIAARYAAAFPAAVVDLDDLTLAYEIVDPKVARIAELVRRRWSVRASEVYRAQAHRRTQLAQDGAERSDLTDRLAGERASDFSFVSACVRAVQQHPDAWSAALDAVVAKDSVLGPGAGIPSQIV